MVSGNFRVAAGARGFDQLARLERIPHRLPGIDAIRVAFLLALLVGVVVLRLAAFPPGITRSCLPDGLILAETGARAKPLLPGGEKFAVAVLANARDVYKPDSLFLWRGESGGARARTGNQSIKSRML